MNGPAFTERRKVVVAGGSGYIGSRLCEMLIARGYETLVLTRDPGRVESLFEGRVRGVYWNGRDEGEWYSDIDGAFGVVNLSGHSIASGRWTSKVRRIISESRTVPVKALRGAIESVEKRPLVLVQGSASGYYGDTGEAVADERSGPGKTFLSSVVVDWEREASHIESSGVRVVYARTAVVLGRESPVLSMMEMPVRMFAGGPVGSGDQWMSWIHIEDEVRAILFLLENPDASGPFNLASPVPVRNSDMMRALCREKGRPFWLRTPGFMLRAVLGRMADELVLSSLRVAPSRLMDAGFEFRHPDIVKAFKEIFH